jgi:hypothetical protein
MRGNACSLGIEETKDNEMGKKGIRDGIWKRNTESIYTVHPVEVVREHARWSLQTTGIN